MVIVCKTTKDSSNRDRDTADYYANAVSSNDVFFHSSITKKKLFKSYGKFRQTYSNEWRIFEFLSYIGAKGYNK